MNSPKDRTPDWKKDSFDCPICGVYSLPHKSQLAIIPSGGGWQVLDGFTISICPSCGECTFWRLRRPMNIFSIIWPQVMIAAPPNEDLPVDIKSDYDEARRIHNSSPRGAAALLRLCIQKICILLGEKGENLRADIKSLTSKGLPAKVEQALTVVRVVGNDAVHPGVLDLRDDSDTVGKLFALVNIIADVLISQPKHIEALYDELVPPSKR